MATSNGSPTADLNDRHIRLHFMGSATQAHPLTGEDGVQFRAGDDAEIAGDGVLIAAPSSRAASGVTGSSAA